MFTPIGTIPESVTEHTDGSCLVQISTPGVNWRRNPNKVE